VQTSQVVPQSSEEAAVTNERLRGAIFTQGLSIQDVAGELAVDPKTIDRWIGGRTPYRRHRYALASLLRTDEGYLWPNALSDEQVNASALAEVVRIYPHRAATPRSLWMDLFERAASQIDVLVYAGFFLAEEPGFIPLLKRKGRKSVAVRLLLGDPDSPKIAERGREEGIDEAIRAKIRNVLVNYRPLRGVAGVHIHLHEAPLYNSIYRVDDEMLVNTHVFGVGAFMAPVLHLRRVPGGDMFTTYADSFERVWATSIPAHQMSAVG
jgi:hypothetical protein